MNKVDSEGYLVLALESEIIWGNIENLMLREEAYSFLHEDEILTGKNRADLRDVKHAPGSEPEVDEYARQPKSTGTFKRIVKFFSDLWNRFRQLISNTIKKFKMRDAAIKKLLNQVNINNVSPIKISSYTEYKLNSISYLEKMSSKLDKVVRSGTSYKKDELLKLYFDVKSTDELTNDINEYWVKGSFDNVKATPAIIDNCKKILASKDIIKTFNTASKQIQKITKLGSEIAQKASNSTDPKIANAAMGIVSNCKEVSLLATLVFNKELAILSQRQSSAFSILKSQVSSIKNN